MDGKLFSLVARSIYYYSTGKNISAGTIGGECALPIRNVVHFPRYLSWFDSGRSFFRPEVRQPIAQGQRHLVRIISLARAAIQFSAVLGPFVSNLVSSWFINRDFCRNRFLGFT